MSIALVEFNRLADLERQATSLYGEDNISFADLFPDQFIRRYTDCITFSEMVTFSGIPHNAIFSAPPKWEIFVEMHTSFPTWHEMLSRATAEWAWRRLAE